MSRGNTAPGRERILARLIAESKKKGKLDRHQGDESRVSRILLECATARKTRRSLWISPDVFGVPFATFPADSFEECFHDDNF